MRRAFFQWLEKGVWIFPMVGKTRASLSPPRWLALGRCDFQSRPALCMEHAVKAAVVGRALRASRAAGTPPHPKSEVGSPKSAPAEQPFQRKERGGFDAKERKEQPGNGREAGGTRGRSAAAKLGLQGFTARRGRIGNHPEAGGAIENRTSEGASAEAGGQKRTVWREVPWLTEILRVTEEAAGWGYW